MIKNLPVNAGDLGGEFDLWVGKRSSSLEESRATHCSILAGRIHEQRSLVGYSPWSHKEFEKTEVT